MRLKLAAASAALIVTAAILTACSSTNAAAGPGGGKFENAIDAYFASHSCIEVPVPHSWVAYTFPLKVSTETGGAKMQMAALTKAGLLSVTADRVYTPTALGKTSQEHGSPMMFCAGHFRVERVSGQEKPVDAGDIEFLKVYFTYGPADVPAWARDTGVDAAYPSLARALRSGHRGSAMMVRKQGVWRVSGVHLETGREL